MPGPRLPKAGHDDVKSDSTKSENALMGSGQTTMGRKAEISFDHARARGEIGRASFQHELAHFEHVSIIRDLQGGAGILLHQQDGDPGRLEISYDMKDLSHDGGREAEARLIKHEGE